MAVVEGKLRITAEDRASATLSRIGLAMRTASAQAKALDKARSSGVNDRFLNDLQRLGASASQINRATTAWKQYAQAQGAVAGSDWTKAQISSINTWERANIAALRKVRSAQEEMARGRSEAFARARQAEAQAEAQAARAQKKRPGSHSLAEAAAGAVAGYQAKRFALDAVGKAADMDKAVRYQRVATDVSEAVQKSLLIPQAKRIGFETEFSNTDIVRAQTATMQSLPMNDPAVRAQVGAAIVDQVRHYAQIMTADMTTSAEGLRSFLQNTNKDISTKEKAVKEATRATNLLVRMAKLGGMDDNDVQQAIKYGAPTGTAAGLSDLTMAALSTVGRRSGLRGDELGVFQRAAASKLVAPTSKGLDALRAAGIDFNAFTRMPGGLSVDNLERFSKGRFGKGFSESQRGRLTDLLEDGDVVTDKEEFTKRVSEIVAEGFGKKKNGQTKAQDAQKIAKMVGDFHKLSVQSVDAEGLLGAILSNPKMTIALLNAYFTDKHGGKASVLARNFGQFREDRAELAKVTDDPGFAARKSAEITGGLYGSLNQLKGAVETLTLSFGEANTVWLKPTVDKIQDVATAVSELPDSAKQAATALGAIGAAYGAVTAVKAFAGGFGMSAAAAEHVLAAKMLQAAAVQQGVPAVAGKPGLGARLGQLGSLGFLGTAGLGVGAMVGTGYALDYFLPTHRAGAGPKTFTDPKSLFKGEEVGPGFNVGLSPKSWGSYDVSKGAGAAGTNFQTSYDRARAWYETSRSGTQKTDSYTLPMTGRMMFDPNAPRPMADAPLPPSRPAGLTDDRESRVGRARSRGNFDFDTAPVEEAKTKLGEVDQKLDAIGQQRRIAIDTGDINAALSKAAQLEERLRAILGLVGSGNGTLSGPGFAGSM